MEGAIDYLVKQQVEANNKSGYTKLIRKPSIERELGLHRGSPALDSGAGSSRSDSPRLVELHAPVSRQYSPSNFSEPPPPPPPRNTPPPPPPHGSYQPVPSNVSKIKVIFFINFTLLKQRFVLFSTTFTLKYEGHCKNVLI